MSQIPSKLKKPAINAVQALQNEPQFAALSQQIAYSKTLWSLAQNLLPTPLRSQCLAASFSEGQWCILAKSPSAAAKVKQLLPTILTHLHEQGHGIVQIRVKLAKL